MNNEIDDIKDAIDDGSGTSGYNILSEARDWFNTGINALVAGTLYSYFGSGLFGADKIKDAFVDDIADAFDRDNFGGEDEEEIE